MALLAIEILIIPSLITDNLYYQSFVEYAVVKTAHIMASLSLLSQKTEISSTEKIKNKQNRI